MKTLIVSAIVFSFLLVPLAGFSIVFVKEDEKGNHYYACEGMTSHPIQIKIVDKNRYRVLGTYIGTVVTATSEADAALKACKEGKYSRESRLQTDSQ